MSDETLGVALTKEICPICAKTEDGPIIMNTRLSKHEAKKVNDMHGKVLQYMKEPCQECQELMKQGFILIGAVEKKTVDVTNPYRSGNIWVVKQEAADEIFKPHGAPKSGVAFIDVNVAQEIGLPNVNLNA